MLCSRCGEIRSTKEDQRILDLSKHKIEGEIKRLDCSECDNLIAIKIIADEEDRKNNNNEEEEEEEEEGENVIPQKHVDIIINIDEKISEKIIFENTEITNNPTSCWKEVKTRMEKIIYYALSQIVYPERDSPNPDKYESMYDFADESDLVMLRWECGIPIGFYTLKLKGSKISSISSTNEDEYAMNTLDTAYIRSEYRNRGFGVEILKNIVEIFPNQDVGLSQPISSGMWKVLKKFLTVSKSHRLKLWEIEGGGTEGNRKLIWFTLLKKLKENTTNQ